MKKVVSSTLCIVIFLLILSPITIKAANEQKVIPTLKIKKINNETGVKITIKNVEKDYLYLILLKVVDSSYNEYRGAVWSNPDYDGAIIAILESFSKKKLTYSINGLPKGKYQFQAVKVKNDGSSAYVSSSKKKTVVMKEAEVVESVGRTEKEHNFSKVKVGDVIYFGEYEQDDILINGTEEIEWVVLSKSKDRILVVSRYILDCLAYDLSGNGTWEKSTIREWLNDSFYNRAFTDDEKRMIETTTLAYSNNSYWEENDGNSTEDKIFFLSFDDVLNEAYGFENNPLSTEDRDKYTNMGQTSLFAYGSDTRMCEATPYAHAIGAGAYYSTRYGSYYNSDYWMLRSPGRSYYEVAIVESDGYIKDYCYTACRIDRNLGVRPAMYISIK